MTLYHCSRDVLQVGDVIEPGNWGKVILQHGRSHNSWFREVILEAIRLQVYPHKPSRLYSTFSCETLESIKFYKDRHMPNGNIYQVNLVDADCAFHRGDFNAVEPMQSYPANMIQIAKLYWEYGLKTSIEGYEHIVCSEIVTYSPLIVVSLIE
jgi:hypothetical protein